MQPTFLVVLLAFPISAAGCVSEASGSLDPTAAAAGPDPAEPIEMDIGRDTFVLAPGAPFQFKFDAPEGVENLHVSVTGRGAGMGRFGMSAIGSCGAIDPGAPFTSIAVGGRTPLERGCGSVLAGRHTLTIREGAGTALGTIVVTATVRSPGA